ncbi:MAG: arylesterase [Pseudomonas sp.]
MMRIIAAASALVILYACGDTQRAAPAPPDPTPPAQAAPTASAEKRDDRSGILFVGTSLTAGYGLGAQFAYPALIQAKIDSAGLPYRVINAGISGETSAGGLRRIEWALQQPVSVLVLELGANDGLRGLDTDSLEHNLDQIIRRTRAKYPDSEIVIAGMQAPPNLGADYTHEFRAVYGRLADRHNAVFIPFLLEGVAGNPALNQSDSMHPTAEGQRIMAQTVWPYLKPLLKGN